MASVVPEAWLNIARKLAVPSDERNPYYHPEFEGYVIGDTIKQADVVLLGYPVMFVTDPVVRKNDLDLYEDVSGKFIYYYKIWPYTICFASCAEQSMSSSF